MKLEQLQYFLMAAKYEHFGKAAKAIPISSSAISHTINQLEEELGRQLFVKKGKRVYLTPHGKLLVERAEELLNRAQAVKDELQSDQIELKGHYRLGATHLLCSHYLTPLWSNIQSKNTNLSAEIFTLRSSQVLQGVVTGELDFGLCFNPQAHPEVESVVLLEGQLKIALRKNHPLFSKSSKVDLTQLSDYRAVLPKAFQGVDPCERHAMFDKFGIKVHPDLLVDSYDIALEKVAHSDSWGFLPDWIIDGQKDRLEALPIPKGWKAPYYVTCIWPRNRLLNSALKQLIEALKTIF